jgi:sialate O-acetylesterase
MNTAKGIVVGLLVGCAAAARADLQPAAIFGDEMVLQRDAPAAIWGTCAPERAITVDFGGQSKQATADRDGHWRVTLDPLPASLEPRTMYLSGDGQVVLRHVLVGDVWLCAGETNMEWTPLLGLTNAESEIAAANEPYLRLFKVVHAFGAQPAADVDGEWQACRPETMSNFSSVGYFFGRDLQHALGVPIGLVCCAASGRCAEELMRRAALAADSRLKSLLLTDADWQRRRVADQKAYALALKRWKAAAAKAKADHKPIPDRPEPPAAADQPLRPGSYFNGMVAPLTPLAVKGVAFYQGESNADTLAHAALYGPLLADLIADWRAAFARPDLPFVMVQLANAHAPAAEPGDSAWARVREGQAAALDLPGVGLACAVDLGDATLVRPPNKQDVGARLAAAARHAVYGDASVDGYGPRPDKVTFAGGAAHVTFRHAAGGLASKPAGGPLSGFALAGADQRFYPAEARIEGAAVVVSSAQVPAPVALRYAWADNPAAGLYGGDGLPALPFRSDDWPPAAE